VIVSDGRVLTFNRDGLVQAALQVAQLKSGYRSSDKEVAEAITRSVGKVRTLAAQAAHPLFAFDDGSQRIYLWFPTSKTVALLVVRAAISAGGAEALARSLVDYGDGGTINDVALSAALATPPQPSPTGSVTP
jgi:hypothetical protein